MTKPARLPRRRPAVLAAPEEPAFAEVVAMIQASRGRALAAVNTELVDLYWRVGEYISRKLETAAWGEGVVEALARYIQRRQPGLQGFTRANLFRMRQFYDAYQADEKVAPLVRLLPWSHHLLILGRCKRPKVSAVLRQIHPEALGIFKDFYLMEFLELGRIRLV